MNSVKFNFLWSLPAGKPLPEARALTLLALGIYPSWEPSQFKAGSYNVPEFKAFVSAKKARLRIPVSRPIA
jgi:hypothetical protein